MSAALVRKSLALVDEDFNTKGNSFKSDSILTQLMPESHKLKRQIVKKGRKTQKVNLLQTNKKYTVLEAKKHQKSQQAIYEANLEKLQHIREACKINLSDDTKEQLLERAITRQVIKKKQKPKEEESTAFTEEDFKKFEEEYFDD